MWNHVICDRCWDKEELNRRPVRVRDEGETRCCWCGGVTVSGIFVRRDPGSLPCEGVFGPAHEDVA